MTGGARAGSDLDEQLMARALELGSSVRRSTSPNPWVGCLIVSERGEAFEGATSPPGGPHAERQALERAGAAARGATAYVTLEPCSHFGRTPPCADALIEAGVRRVVVALEDPDPLVAGQGLERLRGAGVEVLLGVGEAAASRSLAAYLHHRRTGRPFVVLKLAATLDGRIAAPDATSAWITGEAARRDAHELRAESDAILVGAGTVRADDPSLTVRLTSGRDPLRVVLGRIPAGAKVLPAIEESGELSGVLDRLGARGCLQLMVEGGAGVAHDFHAAGLVDRYVIYLAPALFGGDDARAMFAGAGAATIGDLWRGRITEVRELDGDLRIELEPAAGSTSPGSPVEPVE
jgi:diaminohydroxyphosphoribosylaminopyrimidine deaminase / 5-amino-6-(5-phosphoribosylamino)uracil reductase